MTHVFAVKQDGRCFVFLRFSQQPPPLLRTVNNYNSQQLGKYTDMVL